jgi:hypothetical protein
LPDRGAGHIAVLSAEAVALYTTVIGPFSATFNTLRNFLAFFYRPAARCLALPQDFPALCR